MDMRKKLWTVVITLICSFLAGYIFYNHEMNATSVITYTAGGNVTGRVNIAPNGISSIAIGLKKGDKILTSVIGWQLLAEETYTDHSCGSQRTVCNNPSVTAFLSATTQLYGDPFYATNSPSDFTVSYDIYNSSAVFSTLPSFTKMYGSGGFNDVFSSSADASMILAPRNLSRIHAIPARYTLPWQQSIFDGTYDAGSTVALGTVAFYPEPNYLDLDGHLSMTDLSFHDSYFLNVYYHDGVNNIYGTYIVLGGSQLALHHSHKNAVRMRPFAYLDLRNTVFAVSKGKSTGVGSISIPDLPSGYTDIDTATSGYDEMKLRMERSDLSASTSLTQIEDTKGNVITTIVKDRTVNLKASAQAGNDPNGVNTVSALVFDDKGDFVYYKPLESAKGSGLYEFDLTGISAGEYKIGIVNEVYNEGSDAIAESSAITDVVSLKIVEPLSDLAFTQKSGLEVSKNVNVGNTVGTISSQNGAGTITYTIIEDRKSVV